MATKKMTKADYFKQISANYPLTDDEQAFIAHELELLGRKNTSEKKPTATQQANEALKTAIADGMEVGVLYTITDLIKTIPECAGLSTSKVSAVVRQMMDSGIIIRTVDKRKAYFQLAV